MTIKKWKWTNRQFSNQWSSIVSWLCWVVMHPRKCHQLLYVFFISFGIKELTSLPKTLENGQFWRSWKWIWGPTKKRSFTTAVYSATEINALYNVKSILTENSIQRLRWTKMNKMNVFSRRVLATPTSSNSPALACVNAHTHAPCVHRTITAQLVAKWRRWRKRTGIFWTILV